MQHLSTPKQTRSKPSAASKCELTIRFGSERFVFGDGDQRTVIASAWDAETNESITIKVKAPEGDLRRDLNYRLLGKWVNHPKYGWQFHGSSFTTSRPLGRRGIVAYLQQAPGIGPTIAEALYASFGQQAVKKLREDPCIASSLISRFPEHRAKKAAGWLEQHSALEAVSIELTDLFARRHFPGHLHKLCISVWGTDAPAVIRDNPYQLLRFPGVGFLKADRLWLDLGKDPAAIERQAFCLWHAASGASGNTWISRDAGLSALRAGISSADVKSIEAFERAKQLSKIVTHTDEDGRQWFSARGRAEQERTVAACVAELSQDESCWPSVAEYLTLSDHQRTELGKAFRGPVGCQLFLRANGWVADDLSEDWIRFRCTPQTIGQSIIERLARGDDRVMGS